MNPASSSAVPASRPAADGSVESFYLTVRDGQRVGYLVGPCLTAADALEHLDDARVAAATHDPAAATYTFGASRVQARGVGWTRECLVPGKLNATLGFQLPEPLLPFVEQGSVVGLASRQTVTHLD